MIALAMAAVLAALLLATPWRRLPPAGRAWALAGCANTLLFLALPTTAATSPWRPAVAGLIAGSAGLSLALAAVGLLLGRQPGTAGREWLAPLAVAALPAAFFGFFWLIGPLY